MRKTVAIVGTAPASRGLANSEPPEVEIWGLGVCRPFLDRYDRMFEIHCKYDIDLSTPTEENEFYRTCSVPVYVSQDNHCLPTGVLYPFAEIADKFFDYWTSSIAYMVALAIYEEFEEIHIWGVDMAIGSEYVEQRPCLEFWLGIAVGRGITVRTPNSSPVLKGENGSYGLIDYMGVHKQQLEDALSSLEYQRNGTEDPETIQALYGAKQLALGLLGNIDRNARKAKALLP